MRKIRFSEDMKAAARADFIPWDSLRGKNIFITGGTGLIGSALAGTLLFADRERSLGLRISLMTRDMKKAKDMFSDMGADGKLDIIEGCVEELPEISRDVDYIIHAASQTDSRQFTDRPAETIDTAVLGTRNILRLGREKNINGMIYLSSMEVYGYPEKGHKVSENDAGRINPLDVRNSYPVSKQLCEAMCCAYCKEYGLPVKIIRLTQTFGPGIDLNDRRLFAYFTNCILDGKNIVLKTRGETERCYLYLYDAVCAILTVLLKGKTGEAYNAADEATYCSIAEMAELVANAYGLDVDYDIQDIRKSGFLNTLYMDLDTSRLRGLGWEPLNGGKNITEMFRCVIADRKEKDT